jgi:putative PIN family toxin of toxin-antitoxin system
LINLYGVVEIWENMNSMATEPNITLPAELLAQMQALAVKEGKTADELTVELVKREVARRTLERFKIEGEQRQGNMTDEQVQEYVDRVIHEYRAENRGRWVKRVVCDTNVIVSAVHFGGKPMDVLQKAIDGETKLFYSQAILNETQRVLRDKFGYRPARLTEITDILKTYGVEVTPQERLAAVPSDPDDNAIVEAAVAEGERGERGTAWSGVFSALTGKTHAVYSRSHHTGEKPQRCLSHGGGGSWDRARLPRRQPSGTGSFTRQKRAGLRRTSPSLSAKVILLNEMIKQQVRPAELARRLKTSPQEVNRLTNIRHATKIDGIADAMKALGKTLEVRAV